MRICKSFQRFRISSDNRFISENIIQGLTEGDSLYVCTAAIPMFAQHFLPRLTCPIVLVTGDSDCSIPSVHPIACMTIVSSPYIIRWYAQNCTLNHPKVQHMPIGMDYHTMSGSSTSWGPQQSPLEQENSIVVSNIPFYERKPMCYTTFHFVLSRGDRQEAYDSIPKDLVYYEPHSVTRSISHQKQSEYAFVLSPFGGGLDCHRTWEALVLGCIPIIKTSGLDPLFDNLPVLIVKNWSDITQELLNQTITDFKERHFAYEKLTLQYWKEQFTNQR